MLRMGADPSIIIDFLRLNFASGFISSGADNDRIPIKAIVEELKTVARDTRMPYKSVDVTVFKDR
jgi:hypothetical protein